MNQNRNYLHHFPGDTKPEVIKDFIPNTRRVKKYL